MKYRSDGDGYRGEDSGCPEMSAYLGRPSSCLKCKLKVCIQDMTRKQLYAFRKRMKNALLSR